MNTQNDGAALRRLAIECLLHKRADTLGLIRDAVPDATSAFAKAGGEPSEASDGAYLPSGQSLSTWLSDQKELSPHWFTPPVAEPAPIVAKAKVKVAAGASASEKLAAANGDAPARL